MVVSKILSELAFTPYTRPSRNVEKKGINKGMNEESIKEVLCLPPSPASSSTISSSSEYLIIPDESSEDPP
jgi:hypothetical protein